MTLQQIAYIKATYNGLKLIRTGTGMFMDGKWAVVFKIEILHSFEVEKLFDYLKKEELTTFIGHNGTLFIQ